MPFRSWFSARGAHHPVAYSMLTLAGGMIACMIIAVLVSINVSTNREREAREGGRRQACTVINSIDEAYQEEPPQTAAGRRVAESWANLRRDFQCQKGIGR